MISADRESSHERRTASRPIVPWIGLDIGGANIKAAHSDGPARTVPFEVWKRPDELGRAIAAAVATLPASDRAAVTMTAELCDCYPTKARGRQRRARRRGRGPSRPLDRRLGRRRRVPRGGRGPRAAAARRGGQLAGAGDAGRPSVPGERGLLIDIGTTTTDLIPLDRGTVAARGRSDTERLQTGELVYAGVRRTPVCALATELPLRGIPTGLAAELFASTLDVYLTLGDIESNPADLSTADGRPATVEAARDRLARMVGADRDGFSADDAVAFARAADECLLDRLVLAAERACRPTIGRPTAAVVAGSGEFLARRLARRVIEPERPDRRLERSLGHCRLVRRLCLRAGHLASERFQTQSENPRQSSSGLDLGE